LSVAFDEIRVYDGVAERTGAQFTRDAVRHSGSCCKSLSSLIRKARVAGDGYFYLPPGIWPADTTRVPLQKEWIGMSTIPE
jgi:hypothetical protein